MGWAGRPGLQADGQFNRHHVFHAHLTFRSPHTFLSSILIKRENACFKGLETNNPTEKRK